MQELHLKNFSVAVVRALDESAVCRQPGARELAAGPLEEVQVPGVLGQEQAEDGGRIEVEGGEAFHQCTNVLVDGLVVVIFPGAPLRHYGCFNFFSLLLLLVLLVVLWWCWWWLVLHGPERHVDVGQAEVQVGAVSRESGGRRPIDHDGGGFQPGDGADNGLAGVGGIGNE